MTEVEGARAQRLDDLVAMSAAGEPKKSLFNLSKHKKEARAAAAAPPVASGDEPSVDRVASTLASLKAGDAAQAGTGERYDADGILLVDEDAEDNASAAPRRGGGSQREVSGAAALASAEAALAGGAMDDAVVMVHPDDVKEATRELRRERDDARAEVMTLRLKLEASRAEAGDLRARLAAERSERVKAIDVFQENEQARGVRGTRGLPLSCLLYTSDAADE